MSQRIEKVKVKKKFVFCVFKEKTDFIKKFKQNCFEEPKSKRETSFWHLLSGWAIKDKLENLLQGITLSVKNCNSREEMMLAPPPPILLHANSLDGEDALCFGKKKYIEFASHIITRSYVFRK